MKIEEMYLDLPIVKVWQYQIELLRLCLLLRGLA